MSIFDNLFVLELANNHWGNLDRGIKIIDDFADVVHSNDIHAAIKLQFRDVGSFIHDSHRHRDDSRYIKKVAATELSWRELHQMVERVRETGLITMATPFDEVSVDKCVEFGVEIIKIASSDIRDSDPAGEDRRPPASRWSRRAAAPRTWRTSTGWSPSSSASGTFRSP